MIDHARIGVLALDDDEDQLDIIRYAIKLTGHTNFKLYHSDKMLVNDLTSHIHVYIIDHQIPGGLSGLEVLKLIKRQNKSSFVIAYTGFSEDPEMIIEYMNAGCQKWVKKGGPIQHLSDCIKEGLNQAQEQINFVTLMEQELANPLHGKRSY